MSEVKHTKGPWHVGGKASVIIYSPDGHAVANAEVYHTHFGGVAETQANARLIAAAPEILKSLKLIVDFGGDCYDIDSGKLKGDLIDQARAALAKAKGETK